MQVRYQAALRPEASKYTSAHATDDRIGALASPLLGRRTLGWAKQTTRAVLEGFTRNQRLIAVLTGQFGDYGRPPAESSFLVHAMIASHYLDGGYYPVGDSGVFVDAIVPGIQAAGGCLLINAEVAGIVVEDNAAVGVKMKLDGATIRAPVVVSDAGVVNTFARLLPQDAARRHGLSQALATVQPSVAHLCLYVGLRASAQSLRLPRHNIWVYPHEDHERSFAAAGSSPETPLTTRHFCSYGQGEIYGIEHSPQRFRQRILRPATPIRGLYLTGQDIVTCGVGGALMAGVLAASSILRRNLLAAIRQGAPRGRTGEREAETPVS